MIVRCCCRSSWLHGQHSGSSFFAVVDRPRYPSEKAGGAGVCRCSVSPASPRRRRRPRWYRPLRSPLAARGQGCVLANSAFARIAHRTSTTDGGGLQPCRFGDPPGPSPGRRSASHPVRRYRHHVQEPARPLMTGLLDADDTRSRARMSWNSRGAWPVSSRAGSRASHHAWTSSSQTLGELRCPVAA
jgi:hypothetical protein